MLKIKMMMQTYGDLGNKNRKYMLLCCTNHQGYPINQIILI